MKQKVKGNSPASVYQTDYSFYYYIKFYLHIYYYINTIHVSSVRKILGHTVSYNLDPDPSVGYLNLFKLSKNMHICIIQLEQVV